MFWHQHCLNFGIHQHNRVPHCPFKCQCTIVSHWSSIKFISVEPRVYLPYNSSRDNKDWQRTRATKEKMPFCSGKDSIIFSLLDNKHNLLQEANNLEPSYFNGFQEKSLSFGFITASLFFFLYCCQITTKQKTQADYTQYLKQVYQNFGSPFPSNRIPNICGIYMKKREISAFVSPFLGES